MSSVIATIGSIFSKKDSCIVLFSSYLLFLVSIFAIKNGEAVMTIISLEGVSLYSKIALGGATFFDIKNTLTVSSGLFMFVGSLIASINISLLYFYFTTRGEAIMHSGMYSGIGLLLAFVGIGCAACGTVVVGALLSVFGVSAALEIFPYQGIELGYLGIAVLMVSSYILVKKIQTPLVC